MINPMIVEVLASWVTPLSEDVWTTLLALHGDEVAPKSRQPLVLGPVLPDENEPRIANLILARSKSDAQVQQIFWALNVRPSPTMAPPAEVLAASKRLGERAAFANLLADIASASGPMIGLFRIQMQTQRSDYSCGVLPVDLDRKTLTGEPATRLGRSATLEQVGYRFENGVNGLDEVAIIYDHNKLTFNTTIRARGLLRMDAPTWLPYADESADLVSATFFTRTTSR